MKTTLALAMLLFASSPAVAQTVPMDAWESQLLGTLFGTFCGYFPNRVTTIGMALHLKSYAQCKEKFERFYPPCINKVRSEGRYQVDTSEQGSALGQEIGTCIGASYDREAAAPPAPAKK